MKHLLRFPFEIKAPQEEGIIEGYASIFHVLDLANDVVLPGAFTTTDIKEIKFLWQHIPEEPIGQILMLHEDNKGLYIKAKLLLSIKRAHEAYILVKEKIINGLSIGYIPTIYEESHGKGFRYLKKIDLKEISLVTFPANQQATITNVKSQTEYHNNEILNALDNAIKIISN